MLEAPDAFTVVILFLVSGTLRSNLDPFNLHDDVTLWDALKRVYLVDSSPYDSPSTKEATQEDEVQSIQRFTLDTVIEDEGNNLSVGQVKTSHLIHFKFLHVSSLFL